MLCEALTRVAPQRTLLPLARIAAGDKDLRVLLEEATRGPAPHPFAAEALVTVGRYGRAHDGDLVASTAGRQVPAARLPADDQQAAAPAEGRQPREFATATSTGAGALPVPLTQRESDVLRELALGGSYQDIAKTLYVTENTVKTHLAALYRKLGAERRASALRRAREVGLL
jgi:LuxR family maltose regulon positive regulatory protein